AIAAATHGQIADAPADPHDVVDSAAFAAQIEAYDARERAATTSPAPGTVGTIDASVVIGIVYIDANYQGNTWVFNEAWGCDGSLATVDYDVPNLNASPYSDYGFNDSISSFHSYSFCSTELYNDWYFSGASFYGVNAPTVTYNDQASSINWF